MVVVAFCSKRGLGHYERLCTVADSTRIPMTRVRCAGCAEREEETIPHLVLRCTCLGPRQREGTTLPEALGLVYINDPGPPAGDGAAGAVNYAAVRTTKTRLVQWWRATQR